MERKTNLIAPFIIILLTFIAYSNTFSNSFHFDDRYAIFEDHLIMDIGNVPAIIKDIFNRPVLRTTFAINYYFEGTEPFGYHLLNIILHILVSIGVYLLAYLLLNRLENTRDAVGNPRFAIRDLRSFALLSGLVFALHPVHTGSVTYIASRSAVLATMFYVYAIILFIIGFEKTSLKRAWFYLMAFFVFVLGMGVKEIVLTTPFIITLLAFMLLQNRSPNPDASKTGKKGGTFLYIVSFVWLLLPLYALIKYLMGQNLIPVDTRFGPGEILPPYQYFLTELNVVVFHYLKWLFLPIDAPHVDPDIPAEISLIDGSTLIALVIIASLIYTAIRLLNKAPLISFAIFWYFITLIPTSSIFPLGDVAVERHLYLPSIGFALFSGFMLMKLKEALPSRLAFIPYLVSIPLIVLTIKANSVWKSEATLWEDAVAKSPNKIRVLSNRAFSYLETGNLDKAEALYKEFLKHFPGDSLGYNNLGLVYEKKGDFMSAVHYYREAVRLRPQYWLFHMHLGNAYGRIGLANDAIVELETSVNLEPLNPEPMIALASLSAKQGNVDRTIAAAEMVIKIEPKNAMAISLMGFAYEKKGMPEEALKYYRMALELHPGWKPVSERVEALAGAR
ncbi:MAG: tetratricopeptide repeat protein [Deltaproteobacteria bacterium]|nr:tetratricopeptide repeat protein [Deltaproteobacteria bacterium]